jgi:hypothetical protein
MERRFSLGGWKLFIGATAAVVLVAAGLVWMEWTPLQTWYALRGLSRATENDRPQWAERVAQLDSAAVPGLLEALHESDARICANAQTGLACLLERWGPDDSRRADLANQLAETFAGLSDPGQQAALMLQGHLLRTAPATVLPAATRTLAAATNRSDKDTCREALLLAQTVLEKSPTPEAVDLCRALVRSCLTDEEPALRSRAVLLASRPGVDLLDRVVPLLNDVSAEVRRAAMLAVGPRPRVMTDDDLLRWLHDPDAEVSQLCEEFLRTRGLTEQHLRLGRLLTDARPQERLQVVDLLRRTQDLEPGVWLRRLSHDPVPAVRAAAVRSAAEHRLANLADRLEQMAQNDPCPTVRQLAKYYLNSQKPADGTGTVR